MGTLRFSSLGPNEVHAVLPDNDPASQRSAAIATRRKGYTRTTDSVAMYRYEMQMTPRRIITIYDFFS